MPGTFAEARVLSPSEARETWDQANRRLRGEPVARVPRPIAVVMQERHRLRAPPPPAADPDGQWEHVVFKVLAGHHIRPKDFKSAGRMANVVAARLEIVRQLRDLEYTAAFIGAVLGKSENAVVGLIYRAGRKSRDAAAAAARG